MGASQNMLIDNNFEELLLLLLLLLSSLLLLLLLLSGKAQSTECSEFLIESEAHSTESTEA